MTWRRLFENPVRRLTPGQAAKLASLSDDARRLFNDLAQLSNYGGQLASERARLELQKAGLSYRIYGSRGSLSGVSVLTRAGEQIAAKVRR